MSRCNPTLRWGAGTTKDKVVDTAAAREMEQRLAAMRRDRDAIDKMWTQPSDTKQQAPTCQEPKRNLVSREYEELRSPTCPAKQSDEDKKYITFRSSN
jgi:hypothetical protein